MIKAQSIFHIEFSGNDDYLFVHIVDEAGNIYSSGKDNLSLYNAFVDALGTDWSRLNVRSLFKECAEKGILPNSAFYECSGCFKQFFYSTDDTEFAKEMVVYEGWIIGEDVALCYSCQSHRLGGGGSITALPPQLFDPVFKERISKAMKKLESTLEL